MENEKDLFYLTMLIRALRRIAKVVDEPEAFADWNKRIEPVESKYLSIIEKAEALSFGDLVYPKDGYHIPKGQRILSILEGIKETKLTTEYHQPTVATVLSDSFFPTKDTSSKGDISSLWQDIKGNISHLRQEDIKVMAENILNLLFRFAVTIPCSEKNKDISLYDQCRTAAAIAICLYDKSKENNNKENEFRLIGGDFSGIQKYIYQIVSKYAGKNLKGRSFYLTLLSDAVVRKLLSDLKLYRANIVYNSGGSFYILAPNTDSVKTTLDKSISEIEEQIFKVHGSSLYVAIDSVSLSSAEVANKNSARTLSQIWQELFRKRDNKKSSRYADAIKNNYEDFFTPKKIKGDRRDVITGEDFSSDEKGVHFTENPDVYTSEINNTQIEIGKDLKNTDILVVSDKPLIFLKDKSHVCPANLGSYYYLARIRDIESNVDLFGKYGGSISLVFLNTIDEILSKYMTGNICSLQFYGGNSFNGLTFNEMCDNESFSRLGVLRMDVDNLGSIFQGGISQDIASLSRYAALSRSFDYFFSGYLNKICNRDDRVDRSFIVYSGGDDVFIVGSWDTVIDIAESIQSDFHAYTCNNPAFSISGGIAILGAKFPIIAGAKESEEEEERAKAHECKGYKKNSISFFSKPLNWQLEFPAVKNLKTRLIPLLLKDELPKSFLSKVMEHAMNAGIKNHKVTNFRVYWHLAYDLKRMKERYKSPSAQEVLDMCVKEICHSNGQLGGKNINTSYNSLELWAFACRWAELEFRTVNN